MLGYEHQPLHAAQKEGRVPVVPVLLMHIL